MCARLLRSFGQYPLGRSNAKCHVGSREYATKCWGADRHYVKTATDANSGSRGYLNLENVLFFSESFQSHQC